MIGFDDLGKAWIALLGVTVVVAVWERILEAVRRKDKE